MESCLRVVHRFARFTAAMCAVYGVLVIGGLLNGGSCAAQTGTFLDRSVSTDLRMFTYNVNSNQIFPQESATNAAKFDRLIGATQPDIVNIQEIYDYNANQVVALMNSIAPISGGTWYGHQAFDNVIVSKFPLSLQRTNTIPAGDRQQAIALVDLPDAQYARDLYLFNNHYKCCGGNDNLRQEQSDAIVNWMRDARTDGGFVDLPGHTAMAVVGDLNIVDGQAPLNTLIDGNIADNGTYGSDSLPDWDGTTNLDSHPLHNISGPQDYTWRNDSSSFAPGRLDYVIYTDSVLEGANQYVLNTTTMSASELTSAGLQLNDVVLNPGSGRFDHLPLVNDFRMNTIQDFGDYTGDGQLGCDDIAELQSAILGGSSDLQYDIDGNATVNGADADYWISDVAQTLPGDANLNGIVDAVDFAIWNENRFNSTGQWCLGDFDTNGVTDAIDFSVWNAFRFQSASLPAVPEPSAWLLVVLLIPVFAGWRRA